MANELMRRALYDRVHGDTLQHATFYFGEDAKKKQAQDQSAYAAAEKAAHDFAAANSSANQKAGADAARAAASATSTRDAARKYTSSKELNYQARKAQSSAAATSAADAITNARRSGIANAERSAAEAQAAASKVSSRDAAKKRQMDWNNPSDAKFAEWKKNYNKNYYQTHLKEWQSGGKYYKDYKRGQIDSELRSDGSARYYVDSATGERKLKKGFYIDPMTGKVLDLRNASAEARAAMEELQKVVSRGGKSPASDAELRRTYEGILSDNRKAQRIAEQAEAERKRVMSTTGLRGVRPGRGGVDVAINKPSFMDELRTSARNFGSSTKKAATKVGNLGAKAISKGKDYINQLINQWGS